ncbi:MAG: SIR2 family protein [Salinivirgaceae bacterium]|nr:SIR2 family protein [Salinivirgaceae bacterium]
MAIYFFQGNKDFFLAHQENDDNQKIEIIKSRISEFFNMKNVHFLFGSGTSCPAIPNMQSLYLKVKKVIDESTEIKPEDKEDFYLIANNNKDNLEEILGVLYSKREYIKGHIPFVEGSVDYSNCDKLISDIEETIFNEINVLPQGEQLDEDYTKTCSDKNDTLINVPNDSDKTNVVLGTYINFYQKVALRNKDLSRINVFTTNNDLYNETALDCLNIHYINGFNGGLNRYFNPAMFNYTYSKRMDTSIDRFEPVDDMVYLYKIHGSINWIEDTNKSNSYFDIKEETVPKYDKEKSVLIYPTPMKQNKSLGSPYSDLFREFQHKLLEPNGVLFVIGYSFNDEHVNDIIYRALATNSTFNLVIINDIDKGKPICKVNDSRVFRIWDDDKSKPIHYFDRIVNELLPNLDAFKQKDILTEFVKQIKEEKQKQIQQNNENR